MRKLIVGLGNPGARYSRTRHNIGFACLDELAERHGLRFGRGRAQADVATGFVGEQAVVLAKPQTFMNDSGRAVAALARFHDIAPADLIVVHDELDIPFGTLRLREGGSAGGHQGVRSMIQHLGTNAFARLRVGIGRPPGAMPPDRFVLAPFGQAEGEALPEIREAAVAALTLWTREGMAAAMKVYNGWSPGWPAGATPGEQEERRR